MMPTAPMNIGVRTFAHSNFHVFAPAPFESFSTLLEGTGLARAEANLTTHPHSGE